MSIATILENKTIESNGAQEKSKKEDSNKISGNSSPRKIQTRSKSKIKRIPNETVYAMIETFPWFLR